VGGHAKVGLEESYNLWTHLWGWIWGSIGIVWSFLLFLSLHWKLVLDEIEHESHSTQHKPPSIKTKLDDVMAITTNDDGCFVCFVSLVKTA
jgi:hypothetical protein